MALLEAKAALEAERDELKAELDEKTWEWEEKKKELMDAAKGESEELVSL